VLLVEVVRIGRRRRSEKGADLWGDAVVVLGVVLQTMVGRLRKRNTHMKA
jgi:hypothetical protein